MGQGIAAHPQEKEELLAMFEEQIVEVLEWLAAFSPDEAGGVTRLLYSDTWLSTQHALAERMKSYGFVTEFDEVGNLFGKLPGEHAEASSILTGSHIDTVVQGGKYDGAYGIAASLLALRYLHGRYGKPKRTMEVVALCEEEGSRFPMAYWGSGSIAGKRDFEQVAQLQDIDEVSFVDAMAKCGFGEGSGRSSRRHDIGAFIEVHIEQGAVLETENVAVGVVDAIAGQRRMKFEVTGESNHAGTTPMHMRRDALEGVSAMILELRREAARQGAPLVATVGRLNVLPNVPNVVPGKVMFTVDARHADEAALGLFCKWVMETFKRLADERQLEISGMEWFCEKPVPMDAGIIRHLDEISRELNVTSKRMVSGAGHDAQMFEHICPTGMLFVPSRGGISHSPLEYTAPSELAVGVLVLAELLYRLGYGEETL
jgi:allantoate deiminase